MNLFSPILNGVLINSFYSSLSFIITKGSWLYFTFSKTDLHIYRIVERFAEKD